VSVLFGVSLSWADLNSVELHARWTPDLTTNTQPVCVQGGTVGGGVEFHLVAYYSPPVNDFVCDSMVIEEQTPDHPPQTMTITGFTNFSSLGCCSSPPPPGQSRALFCTVPKLTYSFHNTAYKVTAKYHYMIMQPPPNQPKRVDGSISITVNFQNLIVEAQPKILKWDPNVPQNRDTTFSYTLSSVQKKNCQVQILIYDMEGNVVYQANLTQLCPGTYTFTWDGTTSSGSIAPTGLYTFDIIANGKTPDGIVINEDKDEMRSHAVGITQTMLSIEGGQYKFVYYLEGSYSGPSSVYVTAYGGSADKFNPLWGMEGTRYAGENDIYFPQDIIPKDIIPTGGCFYVVVSGLDDILDNKQHNRKPLLERGATGIKVSAAIFDSWISGIAADEELGAGAFYYGKDANNNYTFFERAIKFAQMWRKWGTSEKYPRFVGIGNAELAAFALKSVDVFCFCGHGRGDSIQFGEAAVYSGILAMGAPKPDYKYNPNYIYLDDPNVFPLPLSKLDLVVIGSCDNAYAVNGEFPIVEALVNKGAKAGIAITGYTKFESYDLQHRDITWGELDSRLFKRWASKFWEYATNGYVDNGVKVYPSLQEAAVRAYKESGYLLYPSKKEMEDLTVEGLVRKDLLYPIFYGGVDKFLGNLVIE